MKRLRETVSNLLFMSARVPSSRGLGGGGQSPAGTAIPLESTQEQELIHVARPATLVRMFNEMSMRRLAVIAVGVTIAVIAVCVIIVRVETSQAHRLWNPIARQQRAENRARVARLPARIPFPSFAEFERAVFAREVRTRPTTYAERQVVYRRAKAFEQHDTSRDENGTRAVFVMFTEMVEPVTDYNEIEWIELLEHGDHYLVEELRDRFDVAIASVTGDRQPVYLFERPVPADPDDDD